MEDGIWNICSVALPPFNRLKRSPMVGLLALAWLFAPDALMGLPSESAAHAAAESESTRSAPPDTTPYTRPAVPEDYAPFGKPAIRPDCPEARKMPSRDVPRKSQTPGPSQAPKSRRSE